MPSQPIRILPETKAVMLWADTGHSRPSLETVLFEPDGRQVATNGHGLAILTTPPCPHEYPPVNGLEPMTESPGRMLIRASDLDEVLKALPKPGRVRRFPWLRQAVQLPSGNGTLTFGTTDLEQSRLFCISPYEGQFPTYERVIPQGLPRLRIGFDLAYLKQLVESFETLQAKTVQLQRQVGSLPTATRIDLSPMPGDTWATDARHVADLSPELCDTLFLLAQGFGTKCRLSRTFVFLRERGDACMARAVAACQSTTAGGRLCTPPTAAVPTARRPARGTSLPSVWCTGAVADTCGGVDLPALPDPGGDPHRGCPGLERGAGHGRVGRGR